ncbi:HIRAN domain-containing protein [Anaerosacchariphilus polymeriproducens]|uniref:DNA-binding protein n=1 Tax=Anaerosacchariphilus polymeriproducens TaxID=1812858 RepID=A0A371AR65_9FIRM|nr:HIRAN domain-containing protein [Anaerosacchariphilus polymeriproducens]RDU22076.1 DNA-binding protein [Anaerosacchariphilus polymeriproducens]
MSIKNGKDYLYLVWKSDSTRRQYIIGQLSKNGQYEFQYCGEVQSAIEAGFTLLIPFPDINTLYSNNVLFPVFSSRLPDRKRKDIVTILKKYDLEKYDAYEFLKKSGARLPIDNLQFIDPILDFNTSFKRRFYMAGVRHYLGCDGEECENTINVTRGDEVFLRKEPYNSFDSHAIQVINENQKLLGYIPRYYSDAFTRIINEGRNISCYVTNVDKNKCCSECITLTVTVN